MKLIVFQMYLKYKYIYDTFIYSSGTQTGLDI